MNLCLFYQKGKPRVFNPLKTPTTRQGMELMAAVHAIMIKILKTDRKKSLQR